MGVSTDGQLCFGVKFEEGFEFPWDRHASQDIEEWWIDLKGYKPLFEPYDALGNYKGGKEPPKAQMDAYFDHRRKFKDANPVPIELVNYCSYDCPMYIIAVKSSVLTNNRGYPQEVIPSKLTVTEDELNGLMDFIKTHVEPECDAQPMWWLSSLWG